METLEKLAIKKAIQDRTWLKADMLFKKLTNEMRQRFLQTCLKTTNTAAFEEFLLCLRQPKLTITNNPFFTGEFALVVASCIQHSSKWAETSIAEIDFGGCEIGINWLLLSISIYDFCQFFKKLRILHNYVHKNCS